MVVLDMGHILNKFQNLGPCWSTRYHSTNKRGEDGIQYVHLFCDVIESSWPNGYFNWHHCLKQCCYRNHWNRANTRITFGRQLTMNMISIRFKLYDSIYVQYIWFNLQFDSLGFADCHTASRLPGRGDKDVLYDINLLHDVDWPRKYPD